MIRLNSSIALNYEAVEPSTFILNIQPVQNEHQRVSGEKLIITPLVDAEEYTQLDTGNRLIRFNAPAGQLGVVYQCTVDIKHRFDATSELRESTAAQLPNEVLPFILPSRYCESDRLMPFAMSQFGSLAPGYQRIEAIAQWVKSNVSFRVGTSTWTTSAWDVLQQRQGVCREFAHLMIALCRALNVPARVVTGIDYGADPALGPIDFHAYVEAFLGDRWYLFDPTGISPVTGLIRIGTGRDASDVSFATIFGNVKTTAPRIWVDAVEDATRGIELPIETDLAVSTRALVGAEPECNFFAPPAMHNGRVDSMGLRIVQR